MRIEWTPGTLESAARFIADQPGMHAINKAVAALITVLRVDRLA